MANIIQNAAAAAENKVAKATGKRGIQDLIKAMQPQIEAALPSVLTPERFTRITLTALSSNKKLQECEPYSFIGAMMQAAQLGVECNSALQQAYLIPYNNHGRMECQFQLGYKGLLDLAYRSGQISTVMCQTVYANDKFEYELGLEPKLKHVPAKSDRGDAVYYYAVIKMKDGGYNFSVMSIEDMKEFARKKSKSYNNGPWQTDFDAMAMKTVLKRALKYAPMKSDFVKAAAADETIKTEIAADMLDVSNTIEYTDVVEVDDNTGEVVDNA